METLKLRGADRLIPRFVYCLDKIGLKLRSKCILRFTIKIEEYVRVKYNMPPSCSYMMWKDGTIEYKKIEL